MEMVNGYVFLDLTKANVYSKALKVLGTDKPVVIKDGSGSPYFVDSLTLDGTSFIITKGGKTITIANDNTITSVGDILTIMENIVDSQGNKRFIDGDGDFEEITGITKAYTKWSLSGTHLMIVCAFNVEANTVISGSQKILDLSEMPSYIRNKIVAVYGNVILRSPFALWYSDGTSISQTYALYEDSTGLYIRSLNSATPTNDALCRIQFDLLIDTE